MNKRFIFFILLFLLQINLIHSNNFSVVDYKKDIILISFNIKNETSISNFRNLYFKDSSNHLQKLFLFNNINSSVYNNSINNTKLILILFSKNNINLIKNISISIINKITNYSIYFLYNNGSLGYYGLKYNESFFLYLINNNSKKILFNSSNNLKYILSYKNFSGILNEYINNISLNFSLKNKTDINILNESLIQDNITNNVNFNLSDLYNLNESKNISKFNLKVIFSKKIYIGEKIKFRFWFNKSKIFENDSYFINYFFTDFFDKNITKLKSSKTFQWKQFTPKNSYGNNIYCLNYFLIINNKIKFRNKSCIFYLLNNTNNDINKEKERKSQFYFHYFKNLSNKYILKFSVFHNSSRKKTMNIKINSKQIFSSYFEKNSNMTFNQYFLKSDLKCGLNYIRIYYFGNYFEYNFSNKCNDIKLNSSDKIKTNLTNFDKDHNLNKNLSKSNCNFMKDHLIYNFTLVNYTQDFNKILINLKIKNIENFTCYLRLNRKIVSNKVKSLNFKNKSMESKIINLLFVIKENKILFLNNSKLNLFCKYIKYNKSAYNYFHFNSMNFKLKPKIKLINLIDNKNNFLINNNVRKILINNKTFLNSNNLFKENDSNMSENNSNLIFLSVDELYKKNMVNNIYTLLISLGSILLILAY